MSFRLELKILNDLQRRNDAYFVLFHRMHSVVSGAHCIKVVEDIPKHSATEM